MKTIPFFILDVFTLGPYTGNQLAVFLDLDDQLDDAQMLAMAQEIGFAESTFIKKRVAANIFKVKIFTSECEVPFAGHPTLGTAALIRQEFSELLPTAIMLDLPIGKIPVDTKSDGTLMMTQASPLFFEHYTPEEIAPLLQIEPDQIRTDMPIQEVSTGLPYIMVPLKDKASIQAIKIDQPALIQFLKDKGRHITNSPLTQSTALFPFSTETEDSERDFHTRMFCIEQEQLLEDAATGSANGAFLAYLLQHQGSPQRLQVEQGFEMNRPSLLALEGSKEQGKFKIQVGGRVDFIAGGQWRI